jgi:hypothetical protein
MLQTFLLVLLALAVRDIFYEVVNLVQEWRRKRSFNSNQRWKFRDDEEWEDFLDEINP